MFWGAKIHPSGAYFCDQADVHRESSPTLSSWRTRATVSTGLHARRATGLIMAERQESYTRTESVTRWSQEWRAAYEAEREALLYSMLSFLTGARCSNQAENNCLRGDGDFFLLSEIFGSIFIVCVLRCCCAVMCFLYRTSYQNKKIKSTLPGVCMCVRTACGVRAVFLD